MSHIGLLLYYMLVQKILLKFSFKKRSLILVCFFNRNGCFSKIAATLVSCVSHIFLLQTKNKWLGSKTGQGFYKKEGKEILSLDLTLIVIISFRETSFPKFEVSSGFLEVTLKLIIAFERGFLDLFF